jgi:hypothetical protein
VSRVGRIRKLVQAGRWHLVEHAIVQAEEEGFDTTDVEHVLLSGTIRRQWPRRGTFEVIGESFDGRPLGVVCRITVTGRLRVVTVYEDRPLN